MNTSGLKEAFTYHQNVVETKKSTKTERTVSVQILHATFSTPNSHDEPPSAETATETWQIGGHTVLVTEENGAFNVTVKGPWPDGRTRSKKFTAISREQAFSEAEAFVKKAHEHHEESSATAARTLGLGHAGLSEEQQHVLQMILDGKNVFFTGNAGTGKSYLLRKAVEELNPIEPTSLSQLASPGKSGLLLFPITVHEKCTGDKGECLYGLAAARDTRHIHWRLNRFLAVKFELLLD